MQIYIYIYIIAIVLWRWRVVKPKLMSVPDTPPVEWIPPVAYAIESGPWYYGLPKIKGKE